MKAPLKWIQTFTNITTTPDEFAQKMTMTGSKVEGYDSEITHIRNVVTGKIVSKKRHPNADKLWICSVFLGANIVQIITGAQNIREADIVPVALDDSLLPNGTTVRAGEIRGIKSEGMMCSLAELGLTAGDFPDFVEDGIMVLPFETPIGVDVADIIGLDDIIFDFEITSNRPDCMCISGLAREAAVTYGASYQFPRPKITKFHGSVDKMLHVDNQTPDNCLRYTGAIVENVRVRPSPKWMRERLRRCGMRPINNIVDITNYVMLEYNQPMHAFDYRNVQNGKIIVRQAKDGETIVTLDDVTRTLTPDMMVIADSKKPIAVAGIMGGEYSSIVDDTNTVIFESACFNGANVRATARALGMRTEASSRYERGLDPYNTEPAIMRALELVEKLDAGDVVKGVADAKGKMPKPRTIALDAKQVNQFLGTTIDRDFMADILTQLGCKIDAAFNVTPPTFRGDLEGFADLTEEIARFYGYDKISSTVMSGIAVARPTERQRFDRHMVAQLISCGLYEASTFSFFGKKDLDQIEAPFNSPLRDGVVIRNPLGEDTSIMRTTALPAMLNVLARNYNARAASAGLFELATEYIPTGDKLPAENKKIIIGTYGRGDYYDVKGMVDLLATRSGCGPLVYLPVTDHPTFHPGRTASVSANGTVFALVGEILPTVADNYGIRERVYMADIDLDALYALRGASVKFQQLPKFPAITRDLALVCDIEVPSASVERAIREGVGDILEDLSVFDVYTGNKVAKGKKSIAYNLVLRDSQKTLNDQQADEAIGNALTLLKSIGIELRS
jgi:phenylalanyl-tRNA synthetase beta chain